MRCLYDGEHPCGKCPACLANRQRAFMFRLDQEKEFCSFYFWLTLQYDDDHVPRLPDGEMCFSKDHCRGFFELLRKHYKDQGFSFKHFLVCEYGPNGTHRPHYHCLLLVYSDLSLSKLYPLRQEMKDYISNKAWKYGFVCEKSFHGRVLSYLTKYCCKPEILGEQHTMRPFTLISPGIGENFLSLLTDQMIDRMIETMDFSVMYNGKKIALPRYYVDKIFPHSKKKLESLIPSDPEHGDWSDYLALQSKREQLENNHRYLISRRIGSLRNVDVFKQIKDREININANFDNFRSKLKQRLEL